VAANGVRHRARTVTKGSTAKNSQVVFQASMRAAADACRLTTCLPGNESAAATEHVRVWATRALPVLSVVATQASTAMLVKMYTPRAPSQPEVQLTPVDVEAARAVASVFHAVVGSNHNANHERTPESRPLLAPSIFAAELLRRRSMADVQSIASSWPAVCLSLLGESPSLARPAALEVQPAKSAGWVSSVSGAASSALSTAGSAITSLWRRPHAPASAHASVGDHLSAQQTVAPLLHRSEDAHAFATTAASSGRHFDKRVALPVNAATADDAIAVDAALTAAEEAGLANPS
jgi:hypothetical protein